MLLSEKDIDMEFIWRLKKKTVASREAFRAAGAGEVLLKDRVLHLFPGLLTGSRA